MTDSATLPVRLQAILQAPKQGAVKTSANLETNQITQTSTFNFSQNTLDPLGRLWSFQYEYPTQDFAQLNEWRRFFMLANGVLNQFYIRAPQDTAYRSNLKATYIIGSEEEDSIRVSFAIDTSVVIPIPERPIEPIDPTDPPIDPNPTIPNLAYSFEAILNSSDVPVKVGADSFAGTGNTRTQLLTNPDPLLMANETIIGIAPSASSKSTIISIDEVLVIQGGHSIAVNLYLSRFVQGIRGIPAVPFMPAMDGQEFMAAIPHMPAQAAIPGTPQQNFVAEVTYRPFIPEQPFVPQQDFVAGTPEQMYVAASYRDDRTLQTITSANFPVGTSSDLWREVHPFGTNQVVYLTRNAFASSANFFPRDTTEFRIGTPTWDFVPRDSHDYEDRVEEGDFMFWSTDPNKTSFTRTEALKEIAQGRYLRIQDKYEGVNSVILTVKSPAITHVSQLRSFSQQTKTYFHVFTAKGQATPEIPYRPAVAEIPFIASIPYAAEMPERQFMAEVPYRAAIPGTDAVAEQAAVPEVPFIAPTPEQLYVPPVPAQAYEPVIPGSPEIPYIAPEPEVPYIAHVPYAPAVAPIAPTPETTTTSPDYPLQTNAFPDNAVQQIKLAPSNFDVTINKYIVSGVVQYAYNSATQDFTTPSFSLFSAENDLYVNQVPQMQVGDYLFFFTRNFPSVLSQSRINSEITSNRYWHIKEIIIANDGSFRIRVENATVTSQATLATHINFINNPRISEINVYLGAATRTTVPGTPGSPGSPEQPEVLGQAAMPAVAEQMYMAAVPDTPAVPELQDLPDTTELYTDSVGTPVRVASSVVHTNTSITLSALASQSFVGQVIIWHAALRGALANYQSTTNIYHSYFLQDDTHITIAGNNADEINSSPLYRLYYGAVVNSSDLWLKLLNRNQNDARIGSAVNKGANTSLDFSRPIDATRVRVGDGASWVLPTQTLNDRRSGLPSIADLEAKRAADGVATVLNYLASVHDLFTTGSFLFAKDDLLYKVITTVIPPQNSPRGQGAPRGQAQQSLEPIPYVNGQYITINDEFKVPTDVKFHSRIIQDSLEIATYTLSVSPSFRKPMPSKPLIEYNRPYIIGRLDVDSMNWQSALRFANIYLSFREAF